MQLGLAGLMILHHPHILRLKLVFFNMYWQLALAQERRRFSSTIPVLTAKELGQ